jgi:hypothetical protein
MQIHASPGAAAAATEGGGMRLSIPGGNDSDYQWAQVDDYYHLARKNFIWQAPVQFEIRARVSGECPNGTWGFGFWNDPFQANLGLKGAVRRLPVLPNSAWFLYASSPNYLTLRDDQPANGLLAAVFSSPILPTVCLLPGLAAIPLLAVPSMARLLRKAARIAVKDLAIGLKVDVTSWHQYAINWAAKQVSFSVDGRICYVSPLSPLGSLGLVIWVDNQFATFSSDGRLKFGRLVNPAPVWMEFEKVRVIPG